MVTDISFEFTISKYILNCFQLDQNYTLSLNTFYGIKIISYYPMNGCLNNLRECCIKLYIIEEK